MSYPLTLLTWLVRLTLVAAFCVISYLAFTPNAYPELASASDKVNHFAAFFVLAFLVDYSFPKTHFGSSKWLSLLFYGILIEGIQHYLPYRELSLLDLAADMVGVLAYFILMQSFRFIPVLNARWTSN